MIWFAFFVLGILIGAWRARKKQGGILDMLQYGAAHGIAFAILGLLITVALDRAGLV
jgi:hypothetical protein